MADENSLPDFGSPLRALIDYCERHDIRFQRGRDERSIQFFMVGDAANYHCHWRVSPDDGVVQMRIFYPVMVRSPGMRERAAEFVARANHNLLVGAFQIDMDDGEITYHIPHIVGGEMLEDERIRDLFVTALATADRYFPALMLLMFGGYTPADAVYLAELDSHAEAVDESPSPQPRQPETGQKPPAGRKPRRRKNDARPQDTDELPGLSGQSGEKEKQDPPDKPPTD